MATIYEEITEQMKTAMRGKDAVALGALRGLKTALQNAQIAKGNVHDELPAEEVMTVIRKQIKQREDSIAMFEQAGRADAADKEKAEIAVLAAFLPKEMEEAEILPILEAVMAELGATTKKDMGRVMKEMQARTEGRAPGKVLSKLVGARLS
ncbi:MAG: GatB/YqeY domain-containing protein [Akkermansia sp.]|nr:GatB/YqeY domain-containing protein [Akkermansia sp.]